MSPEQVPAVERIAISSVVVPFGKRHLVALKLPLVRSGKGSGG